MTGKQKRYLRSLAATMPPVVQIGKNGLENSVIDSARAALMARELIKVKLHNNSPEETIFQELAKLLVLMVFYIKLKKNLKLFYLSKSSYY